MYMGKWLGDFPVSQIWLWEDMFIEFFTGEETWSILWLLGGASPVVQYSSAAPGFFYIAYFTPFVL